MFATMLAQQHDSDELAALETAPQPTLAQAVDPTNMAGAMQLGLPDLASQIQTASAGILPGEHDFPGSTGTAPPVVAAEPDLGNILASIGGAIPKKDPLNIPIPQPGSPAIPQGNFSGIRGGLSLQDFLVGARGKDTEDLGTILARGGLA